jgi:hypothetical protein
MTIDERIEFLLKMQESHEANLNRLFDLQAETQAAIARSHEVVTRNEAVLGRFISRTDETLNMMARILESHEHRLSDLEGGTR